MAEFNSLNQLVSLTIADRENLLHISDASAADADRKLQLKNFVGRMQIGFIDNTSTADEFNWTSIPADFQRLIIQGRVRCDATTGDSSRIHIYFNGSTDGYTDANYHSGIHYADEGGKAFTNLSASGVVGLANHDNASNTDLWATFEIIIENYTSTTEHKVAFSQFAMADSTTPGTQCGLAVAVNDTDVTAISQITLRCENHGSGDRFDGIATLYGEN